MRDVMNWSLPLFRVFGISVRVHLLYILFTAGMILRVIYIAPDAWLEMTILLVGVFFISILLHEFGHCFAARSVDGEADKILIWPLGGLASVDLPHVPRAHLITAAAGPAVNLLICILTGGLLLAFSWVPPLNPFRVSSTIDPELIRFTDGASFVKPGYLRVVRVDTGERIDGYDGIGRDLDDHSIVVFKNRKSIKVRRVDTQPLPDWALWTARIFFVNWLLLLFNLLPAFPLDGGRMLQAVLWGRGDFREATTVAIYVGGGVAMIFLLLAMAGNEMLLAMLSLFMFSVCIQQWYSLESHGEESFLGYDFSQGYTSLEKEQSPPPKPKKVGWFKRWQQARLARKIQRADEGRLAEETRLDELLEKVHRNGKASLTEEERRFMARVSARYRNKP